MERPFSAYRGDEPYVFVSYAHEDAALVYPELSRLRDDGFNIWYDEGISPGASWRDELALALTECSVFLFFITARSVNSRNCIREVEFSLSREREIICVYLEEVKLPIGLELGLGGTQAVVRSDHSTAMYQVKLKDALSHVLQHKVPFKLPVHIHEPDPEANGTSIAILPLVNRTNDADQEYLGDGITEELINGLAHVDGLKVASQLAVFSYKSKDVSLEELGRKLRVSHVVSGSVQRSGDRIRINIRLDNTNDGTTLWSERYDRVLDDIFELQDDIAKQVTDALKIELNQSRSTRLIDVGTNNVDAYNEYLLGANALKRNTRRSLAQGLNHYTESTRFDPSFGAAYMGQVMCCIGLSSFDPGDRLRDRGLEALETARSLGHEPDVPWFKYRLRLENREEHLFDRVKRACEKVRSPDPEWRGVQYQDICHALHESANFGGALLFDDRYPEYANHMLNFMDMKFRRKGFCLASLGRFEEAIKVMEERLEREGEPGIEGDLVLMYSRTGQVRKAEEALRRIEAVWPESFPRFHHLFWCVDRDEARRYLVGKNFPPGLRILGFMMLEELDSAAEELRDLAGVRQYQFLECWPRHYICPVSALEAIEVHPELGRMAAECGVDAAGRERVRQMVNELEDVTGIHVDADPPRQAASTP